MDQYQCQMTSRAEVEAAMASITVVSLSILVAIDLMRKVRWKTSMKSVS